MPLLLIGNVVCLVGSLLMVAIGLIKSKEKILIVQCFQFGVLSIGNLLLGGISGCISDALCIIRNIVSLKREFTTPCKVFFISMQIILTMIFNNMGIVGWLPVIAACIFTWCLDTGNEVLLKLLIILAQVMWAIYDLSIHNYSTLIFDGLTIISNLVGIYTILRDRHRISRN